MCLSEMAVLRRPIFTSKHSITTNTLSQIGCALWSHSATMTVLRRPILSSTEATNCTLCRLFRLLILLTYLGELFLLAAAHRNFSPRRTPE